MENVELTNGAESAAEMFFTSGLDLYWRPLLCLQCRSLLRSFATCSLRQQRRVDRFASWCRWAASLSLRCRGTKTPRLCPPAPSTSSSTTKRSTHWCCWMCHLRTLPSTAAKPRTTMERTQALPLSLWKVRVSRRGCWNLFSCFFVCCFLAPFSLLLQIFCFHGSHTFLWHNNFHIVS